MEVSRGVNAKTFFSVTVLIVLFVTVLFQADYLSKVSSYHRNRNVAGYFFNSSRIRAMAPGWRVYHGYVTSGTTHAPMLNHSVVSTPPPNPDPDPSSCKNSEAGVAFIKTHKTGSTTLGHIVNRYGYQRNMSFVLSKVRSNGHLVYTKITPDSPRQLFLKPLDSEIGAFDNYTYDMISVHVRYFREAMDTFMKPGTRYITVIRDPSTQFESAFSHFQFDDAFPADVKARLINGTVADRLAEWFRHPEEYREKLKFLKWDGMMGVRYYYAQNNQIFDMGLDITDQRNDTAVNRYLDKLSQELDMVVITEYFEESLLVMKKQFCWDIEDILFIPKNERREQVKNFTMTPWLRDRLRGWNDVDFKLYRLFNETLWRKVKEYGEAFEDDLREYRRLQKEVFDNCTKGEYFLKYGRYMQNVNYKPAQNCSMLCRLIAEHKRELMARVRKRQLEDIARRKKLTSTSGEKAQAVAIKDVNASVQVQKTKVTQTLVLDNG